jgi:hypothetical protein
VDTLGQSGMMPDVREYGTYDINVTTPAPGYFLTILLYYYQIMIIQTSSDGIMHISCCSIRNKSKHSSSSAFMYSCVIPGCNGKSGSFRP